jgi:hypothetical protein
MENEKFNSYRENIDLQIKDTFKDIDTNISYIIIGSIGFFITMLDKFVDIHKACFIPLLFISFAALIISFVLFLFNKHMMAKDAAKILEYMDSEMAVDPTNNEHNQKLYELWKKSNNRLTKYRGWIYFFLGMGVILQVTFFTTNILFEKKNENEEPQKLRIEVVRTDSEFVRKEIKAIIDSLKLK